MSNDSDYSKKHVEFVVPEPTPEEQAELNDMYAKMDDLHMKPLWNQIGGLMPNEPDPQAIAHRWDWSELIKLARRSGELVPVGRGGERRAIGLANPGLGGPTYIAPTLWAAIQYLAPGENAPEHRHSQNAFRFVIEGEGVWTVVNGDAVPMRRGDFLLTPGWNFHGHHNIATEPMAWLDGLDIPFAYQMDTGFFEYGSEKLTDESTPDYSRSERLWAHPGLRPLAFPGKTSSSTIGRYAWEHTDAALNDQLALEDAGFPGVVGPGHAAIRYTNPTTGGDVMSTIRAEFHRLRPGAATTPIKEVGNRVFQVFEGSATIKVGEETFEMNHGDVVNVPSWKLWSIEAGTDGVDLFGFSDHPIFEKLDLARTYTPEGI
ncbi:cupin domain-containing protein [Corynebacterium suedekumii]|uniref:Cupin domain-containing protein n=1 Tax=Corynebacterium suedekumii TaxID=3049801 RepID=A0ABY8VIV1_9CORY|nr:cupin domain-containing protein [Corynebacterium suedekumii]WIM69267.1 cupin domain-containing protein [Corynebacterium suedekumii]